MLEECSGMKKHEAQGRAKKGWLTRRNNADKMTSMNPVHV
jgi:hypothetical protein